MKEKLFYQAKKPNVQEGIERARKGFGNERAELVSGFAGAFLYSIPDVYVSECIGRDLERYEGFADTLMDFIRRFVNDDYGFVTAWENGGMTEDKYIGGSSWFLIGRYPHRHGGIVLESFFDRSLFYYFDEDVSKFQQEQQERFDTYLTKKGIEPRPMQLWRQVVYHKENNRE